MERRDQPGSSAFGVTMLPIVGLTAISGIFYRIAEYFEVPVEAIFSITPFPRLGTERYA